MSEPQRLTFHEQKVQHSPRCRRASATHSRDYAIHDRASPRVSGDDTRSPDSAHLDEGIHSAEQTTWPSDDEGRLRSATDQLPADLNGVDASTWSASAPDNEDVLKAVLEKLCITGEPPSGWAPTAASSPEAVPRGGDSADYAAEVLPSTGDTDELPAAPVTGPGLPEIQVKPGQLQEALTAAEQILNNTGRFFQRGDRIVCMRIDSATKTAHIEEMAGDNLVVELAGLSQWSSFDKRSGGWIAIDPCPRICNFLAKSWKYKQLKVLRGTVYTGGQLIFDYGNTFAGADLKFQIYEAPVAVAVASPTAIPSSSEWTLLGMSLLIVGVALLHHRRTGKKSSR